MIDAMNEQGRQSRKSCGHMTFLLCHAFIIVYLTWALLPTLLSSYSAFVLESPTQQDDGRHPPIDQQHHHHNYYYLLRISNDLAAYIPIYLALLFVCVPPLYMGLNMKSVPPEDDIDWIWDNRSNTCNNGSCHDNNSKTETTAEKCSNDDGYGFTVDDSLPDICDVDVRIINSRVFHRRQ